MNRTIHTDDDVPSCLNPVELCLIIIKDSIQYLHSLNMNGGVYMDILGTSFHWCSGNNNSLFYLVNQSPGVLLGDGSREHFEDLIKVETIIRV